MPILTKQLCAINKILDNKSISHKEKIGLLKRITIEDKPSNCYSCDKKRLIAKRLLDDIINFEINKIVKAGLSSNGKDTDN